MTQKDICVSGYVLKRKYDGAYLSGSVWSLKYLPTLYTSPAKIKSLYKVRPMDIFPREKLQLKTPFGGYYGKYNYKNFPDITKELEAFAEKEFEIVKMEISTKEIP